MMRLAFGPGSLVLSFGPAGLVVIVDAMFILQKNSLAASGGWWGAARKGYASGARMARLVAGEQVGARLRGQRVSGAAGARVHQIAERLHTNTPLVIIDGRNAARNPLAE